MSLPIQPTIREAFLTAIRDQQPKRSIDAGLQQSSILRAVATQFGRGNDEAILTQWGDLFRTGLLAWGADLQNPDPPHFHLTESGRVALTNLTRDPSNPTGYLRHLSSIADINAVAKSYLTEGLDCYVAGLFRAAAVMVGAAAECIVLDLRDRTVARLTSVGSSVPSKLKDWKIKTVSDSLSVLFENSNPQFPQELREAYEASWTTFSYQIRRVRNEAGHPTSVAPVTPDMVHASLLIFPELARLAAGLAAWVETELR